jgi:hypothetical protein
VQDFQFLVTDDRYAVPSIMLVQTKDAASARHLAQRLLHDRHHHMVEVRQNEAILFTLSEDEGDSRV